MVSYMKHKSFMIKSNMPFFSFSIMFLLLYLTIQCLMQCQKFNFIFPSMSCSCIKVCDQFWAIFVRTNQDGVYIHLFASRYPVPNYHLLKGHHCWLQIAFAIVKTQADHVCFWTHHLFNRTVCPSLCQDYPASITAALWL